MNAENTKKTSAEIEKIAADIKATWTNLKLDAIRTKQHEKEVNIKEFEAKIRSEYPTLWQIPGNMYESLSGMLEKLFNEAPFERRQID